MPYFAIVNPKTNEVIRVSVAKSSLWCEHNYDGSCVTIEKGKAGIGMTYHPDKDLFFYTTTISFVDVR